MPHRRGTGKSVGKTDTWVVPTLILLLKLSIFKYEAQNRICGFDRLFLEYFVIHLIHSIDKYLPYL